MLGYVSASYDPRFFRLFRKNLGDLREFLGKWFTAFPLAKNCPHAYVLRCRCFYSLLFCGTTSAITPF